MPESFKWKHASYKIVYGWCVGQVEEEVAGWREELEGLREDVVGKEEDLDQLRGELEGQK